MEKKECCGTCRFHKNCEGEWTCCNERSDDGYGLETAYDEVCDEWETR